MTTTAHPAWAQLEDENDLWYERFVSYLRQAAPRSVNLAAKGHANPYPAPSNWHAAAKRFNWPARAGAYDEAGRPPLGPPRQPTPASDDANPATTS